MMFLRYGSDGNFEYDACPKCGFAYGTNHYDPAIEGDDFWKEGCILIRMFERELKELKLPLTRKGLYRLTLTWSRTDRDEHNVFHYSKESVQRIMRKGEREIVQFT
jgi:hypothetical protein